jgi:hypothetical protein
MAGTFSYDEAAASSAGSGATVAFVWDAVTGATSYVLQVGTATGQSNTHDANVGDNLAHDVALAAGTYYSRTVVVGGASDGELTAGGERGIVVASDGTVSDL